MPKYYCEYCDIYLTHSSPGGRRQHASGRKHINMKIEYYQNLIREKGFVPPIFAGTPLPLLPLNIASMMGGNSLSAAAAAILFRPQLMVNPPVINPAVTAALRSTFPPPMNMNAFPSGIQPNLGFVPPPALTMPIASGVNINTQNNNSNIGVGGINNNYNVPAGIPAGPPAASVGGGAGGNLNMINTNMQNSAFREGFPAPPPLNF